MELIDKQVKISLEIIGQIYELDRVGLWWFDTSSDIRRSHEWAREGMHSPRDLIMTQQLAPWTTSVVLNGNTFKFETIEEIPAEETTDRTLFQEHGIKSCLILPLFVDDRLEGGAGLSTVQRVRSWPERDVSELRLLVETVANAISRANSLQTIQQRERDLARSEALAHVGSYSYFGNEIEEESRQLGGVYCSQELLKMLDAAYEESSADLIISRIHPDDRERVVNTALEWARNSDSVLGQELRVVRPNGEIVYLESRSEKITDPQTGNQRIFGAIRDVSERMLREQELRNALSQIEQLKRRLETENLELRHEINTVRGYDKIVGTSPALERCLELVEKVAPTDATVLILGETGVGKELIAHTIHELSTRKDRYMTSVNCAALPPQLIESELFGHEKGAFTDAGSQRKGRFEIADKGTLFLDEIGELPLPLQSKLLRVIQEGEFERIGGNETIQVDVRLILSTNRELKNAVDQGSFRADLYYRISNFPIEVPSLSERKEDIPLLVEHFVHKYAAELGKDIKAISPEMINYLNEQSWPGNVRELEGFIQRALITNTGDVLTLNMQAEHGTHKLSQLADLPGGNEGTLEAIDRAHIIDVLGQTNWVVAGEAGAAKILGMPSSTLRSRMKRLGIKPPDKTKRDDE